MLTAGQELHPAYLRTLRQTLNDVLAPELESEAARTALAHCDAVLTRMIAAREELAAVQAGMTAAYRSCLADAASLLGESAAPPPHDLPATAAALQLAAGRLFALLDTAASGEAARITALLARIAAAGAAFHDAYEEMAGRVAMRREALRQSLVVTGDAVQQYLARCFPAGGLRLRRLAQIPGGRSKLTLMLSLQPNALLPSEIVLRFDNPGSAQNTAVAEEYPVMRALYDAGVRAPEPLWLEPAAAALGAPFLAMRRMDGAAPGSYWSAENASPALAASLAAALAALHRRGAGVVWPVAPENARDAVAAMLAESEARSHRNRAIASLVTECAYGWLRRHLHWITGPTVPVHGDVHFGNVLADQTSLVCLTDWEFCHPGHPAEDLAFTRRYIEQIMPWDDFLAAYRGSGGADITGEQIRFFAVWGLLRNITLATAMLGSFNGGAAHDIQNLAIALDSRPRLEALLARLLAKEMASGAS